MDTDVSIFYIWIRQFVRFIRSIWLSITNELLCQWSTNTRTSRAMESQTGPQGQLFSGFLSKYGKRLKSFCLTEKENGERDTDTGPLNSLNARVQTWFFPYCHWGWLWVGSYVSRAWICCPTLSLCLFWHAYLKAENSCLLLISRATEQMFTWFSLSILHLYQFSLGQVPVLWAKYCICSSVIKIDLRRFDWNLTHSTRENLINWSWVIEKCVTLKIKLWSTTRTNRAERFVGKHLENIRYIRLNVLRWFS